MVNVKNVKTWERMKKKCNVRGDIPLKGQNTWIINPAKEILVRIASRIYKEVVDVGGHVYSWWSSGLSGQAIRKQGRHQHHRTMQFVATRWSYKVQIFVQLHWLRTSSIRSIKLPIQCKMKTPILFDPIKVLLTTESINLQTHFLFSFAVLKVTRTSLATNKAHLCISLVFTTTPGIYERFFAAKQFNSKGIPLVDLETEMETSESFDFTCLFFLRIYGNCKSSPSLPASVV